MVQITDEGGGGRAVVLEGVYPPSEDTFLLMDAVLSSRRGKTVLELCCGTGIVGLSVARETSRVVAVDINPVAIRNTMINYDNSGLSSRLDAVVGDLFTPLCEVFDLVIMNPPYLEDTREAADASWSGGIRGRRVIDRFLDEVGNFLAQGGRAVFVQSDLNGLKETMDRSRANGMVARVVGERVFRFETLLAIEVEPR